MKFMRSKEQQKIIPHFLTILLAAEIFNAPFYLQKIIQLKPVRKKHTAVCGKVTFKNDCCFFITTKQLVNSAGSFVIIFISANAICYFVIGE